MTTWGNRIEVDGVRPDWLRDEPFKVFTKTSEITGMTGDHPYQWAGIIAIALSADHPYYKATHAGYIYWPGGDKAPDDWDSRHVLRRDGGYMTMKGGDWQHSGNSADVIGYRRRQGAPPPPPEPFYGMTGVQIDAMIQAVKAGDLIAAQACLPVNPIVKRAREICAKHHPDQIEKTAYLNGNRDNVPFMLAVVEALSDA